MPRQLPPIETRFPINRPYAPNKGNKGPYLTPLLKKFLNKHITYEDPSTQKKIKGKVKDAVLWRLLLNACQGENDAIKVILDRIDGKVKEIIEIDKRDAELLADEIEIIPKDQGETVNRLKKFINNQ